MKTENTLDTHIPTKSSRDVSSYPYAVSGTEAELGTTLEGLFEPSRPRRSSRLAWWLSEFIVGPFFLLVTLGYTYAAPQSISNRTAARETFRRVFKRTVDIVGSVVGLGLALPLFLVFAILIKLGSRGPVFYSQVRVGEDRRSNNRRAYKLSESEERRRRERRREDFKGRLIKVVKFRTMVHHAEKDTGPVWAAKNDPRITRIGRFLRTCRLDELPQLWSVMIGHMSLVGPRPERPVFVRSLEDQVPGYHRRLTVKPGVTGLAQVENGYDESVVSVAEKVKTDLRYIDNWSPALDIKILLRTVRVVLTGRGAK